MATTARAPNHRTAGALMDATERLLVGGGHASVSARRVSEEAGLPHGLVRYHFGTVEALMVRTLERATGRIIERQRALYAGDRPFLEKWRTAMEFFEVDLREGYPKLVAELFAKAWTEPVYRDPLRATMEAFTEVLGEAVTAAAAEYDGDVDDVVAVATLIRTFQIGMLVERLAGIDIGHAALNSLIDRRLESAQNQGAQNQGGVDARPTS